MPESKLKILYLLNGIKESRWNGQLTGLVESH
jgi:hypothetical protein